MDFDWKDLDPKTTYRVTVVRAPLAPLLEAGDDEAWGNWEEDWPTCREWLSRPPTPEELSYGMEPLVNILVTLEADWLRPLLDILEGRDFEATGRDIEGLRGFFPMALEPDGDGALRLLAPDAFLDAWPHNPRAAALHGNIDRLETVQRCMEAFANLYGAIRLDDALSILRGWGLWDDTLESGWRATVERRIRFCGMFRTVFSDGVLYMALALGPGFRPRLTEKLAKDLLRETGGIPRWLPPSAEAFLEWADPDHFEDTPAAAGVMSYGLSLAAPHLAGEVHHRVALAAADIRSNVADLDPDQPSIFGNGDDDGDGDDTPVGDAPFAPDPLVRPKLGFGDDGLSDALLWQFTDEQRRWLFNGHTLAEFREWLLTPEGQAWDAAKRARRPPSPRGPNFQKPKKKKKGKGSRHRRR